MSGAQAVVAALNRRYFLDYPHEAALRLEEMSPEDAALALAEQPVEAVAEVWEHLAADMEQALVDHLPETVLKPMLHQLEPGRVAWLLSRLEEDRRDYCLSLLDSGTGREVRSLLAYPVDSAGQMMDPRFVALHADLTAFEALARLRQGSRRGLREILLVDEDGRLAGRVDIQDLALAEQSRRLASLAQRLEAVVVDTAPREEVVEKLEQETVSELPVVDFDGRLVGVIRQSAMVSAMQEETSVDIQTMVGASKEERALSTARFAVAKRLPWLQINLLTAFLAASVVGLFEDTIAKYTALAVLLPVVAGQSGNAGAQALAVTMRGLVLREISLRQWRRVVWKEINTGLFNGLAIAATTAVGVYVWSRSLGLVAVISIAMVVSMIVAGFAGAVVPIALQRLGQDPAQSSSIILTTVTDVVGFFSFLGIATLLSSLL